MLIEWDQIEREEEQRTDTPSDSVAPAPDAEPGERFAWLMGG
jgi:hypothetical protein